MVDGVLEIFRSLNQFTSFFTGFYVVFRGLDMVLAVASNSLPTLLHSYAFVCHSLPLHTAV